MSHLFVLVAWGTRAHSSAYCRSSWACCETGGRNHDNSVVCILSNRLHDIDLTAWNLLRCMGSCRAWYLRLSIRLLLSCVNRCKARSLKVAGLQGIRRTRKLKLNLKFGLLIQIRAEVMNAIIQINTQTDAIVVQQGERLIAHANHLPRYNSWNPFVYCFVCRSEIILARCRSPRLHIEEAGPAAPSLQLSFQKKLLQSTFYAEDHIKDEDDNKLQVALRQIESGQIYSLSLGFPVEVEIVVVDGNFPGDSSSEWSTEDFNSNILKEREGRKPLLYGVCKAKLHEGIASFGEIKLTDSSILVKSRKFKLGAKVSPSSHVRWMIKPTVTECFVVLAGRSKRKSTFFKCTSLDLTILEVIKHFMKKNIAAYQMGHAFLFQSIGKITPRLWMMRYSGCATLDWMVNIWRG